MYVFIGGLKFNSPGVYCYKSGVVWRVDSATAFERGCDGCVGALASIVVSAN